MASVSLPLRPVEPTQAGENQRSLEGPEGMAFHTGSRVFTEAEMTELDAADRRSA